MKKTFNKTIKKLKKLQKKLNNPKTIVLLILFFLALTYFKRLIFFFVVIVISIAAAYFLGMLQPPIDLSPFFFFSIVTSAAMGIKFGLIYYFIGAVIPWLALGGRIDASSLIYISMNSFFIVLSTVLTKSIRLNIVYLGILMIVIQTVLGLIIKKSLAVPVPDIIRDITGNIIVNLIYFVYFGNLFFNLLK